MIAGKILSVQDCNFMNEELDRLEKYSREYFESFTESITVFEKNPIAQSFFASGPFGKEKEEEIIKLRNAFEKYTNILKAGPDSLIPQTRKYINAQLNLLNAKKVTSLDDVKKSFGNGVQ